MNRCVDLGFTNIRRMGGSIHCEIQDSSFSVFVVGALIVGLLSGPLPETTIENKGLFHSRVELNPSETSYSSPLWQLSGACMVWKYCRRSGLGDCAGSDRWNLHDEERSSGKSGKALARSLWTRRAGLVLLIGGFCFPFRF